MTAVDPVSVEARLRDIQSITDAALSGLDDSDLLAELLPPGAQRPVTTVPVPPGSLLCFCTDGLVERPGEVVDEGLDRLCRAVTAQSPEAACAAVMGTLVGGEAARDDIALLMIRRPAAGEKDADA